MRRGRVIWLAQWGLLFLCILLVCSAGVSGWLRAPTEGGFSFGFGISGMLTGISVIPLVLILSLVHWVLTKQRMDILLIAFAAVWFVLASVVYVRFPYK